MVVCRDNSSDSMPPIMFSLGPLSMKQYKIAKKKKKRTGQHWASAKEVLINEGTIKSWNSQRALKFEPFRKTIHGTFYNREYQSLQVIRYDCWWCADSVTGRSGVGLQWQSGFYFLHFFLSRIVFSLIANSTLTFSWTTTRVSN